MMDYICTCGHPDTKHFAPGMKCLGSHECQCHRSQNSVVVDGQEKVIEKLTAALEKIRDTARKWEGRTDTVPYWNLGDIAAATLKKIQEGK